MDQVIDDSKADLKQSLLKPDGEKSDQKPMSNEKLKINQVYCFWYTVAFGVGTFQTAWAISGNANTGVIFKDKLGWDETTALVNNTIISTAGAIGVIIGSFMGGCVLKLGRRNTVLIGQAIAIASALPSMMLNVPMLTLGRVLCGIGGGVHNVAFGKILTETIPASIMAKYCMAHNGFICIGFFLVFLLGAFLPDSTDVASNIEDSMWRIIWLGPAAVGVFEVLITLYIYKLEPINYCVMLNREQDGREHLAKVYRKKDESSPESLEEILAEEFRFLQQNTTADAVSTTFNEAVCGRKYRGGTWFCFIFNVFNQQSGINAVNVYANSLLVQMQAQGNGDDFPISPIQGGYMVGAANMIFALGSILYIEKLGRRPIMIAGQFGMFFCLFMCGLAVKNEWAMTSFIFVLLFVGAFQATMGSIAWLYIPETCVDSGAGFAASSQFINLTVICLTFDFMIHSGLGVGGAMWYHAAWNLVGLFFIIFVMRETRGLTDVEKKTLYTPQDVIDKEAREMELQELEAKKIN